MTPGPNVVNGLWGVFPVERGCKVSNVHVHWLSVFVAILALRPGLSSATLMAGLHTTSGPVDAPRNIAAPDQQPTFRTSNIWLSARVAHGDALEHARSYRLYNEPLEIVVILTIAHKSLEPATADQQVFAKLLRSAMKDDDDKPIATETDGTFWRSTERGRVQLGPHEPLRIVSGHGIEWELRFRRADGQRFATGRHVVDLSLVGPLRTLRLGDGSTPGARSSETSLAIHLGHPRSAGERSRMHELAAHEAVRERRFEDAAAAAQKAIDANPSNTNAYLVLGGASLQLNKCREAAVALEKVLQRARIGGRAVLPYELLAQAYVCSGDEKNARRVLRLQGIPKARLDAEIAHLRELVSRRRTQKPR